MMTAEGYQKMIVAGLDGLPDNLLAEIADFVFFLRHKATDPDAFAVELDQSLVQPTMRAGWQESLAHLEEEFVDYEQRFPLN